MWATGRGPGKMVGARGGRVSDERRRNRKRVATSVTGVALAGLVGAAAVRAQRARRWSTLEDPCGPEGLALPDGEARTVRTADGAELDVLVAGPATGPTVMLSHCWTGAKELWAPVARRLVADGHRVVLYDQRGHGRSTFGDGTATVDRLGDDLLAILEATGATEVVLAGHSMGGMTVQGFAAGHPDELRARVRGIVLVATAARPLPRPLPAPLVQAAVGDAVMQRLARRGLTAGPTRGAVGREAHRAHVRATHDLFVGTPGVARAGFLVGMSRMDLRRALSVISVPTTILVGTHDRLTPLPRARELAAAIPHAELRVLPGFGHMLPIEAPAEVAGAITGTVARTLASSRA
jgi:pimeloyl-ACP methyl ester carboxylesterase